MRITENENGYTAAERQYLIYRYLLENSDKDHVITKQQIIDYLDTYDIKIHANTIYNDLNVIASMYKIAVDYDQKKKGYWLKDTLFAPYEIRLIGHSIQSFKYISDKKARSLIDRLKTLTDHYTASSIHSDAYVLGRIHSSREEIAESADRIYQAIIEDKQIRCDFTHGVIIKKNGDCVRAKITTFISPYKLVWENGALFVLVFEHRMRMFAKYRIDHLENISKPLNIPREGKAEYKEHLKNGRYDPETFLHPDLQEMTVTLRVSDGFTDAFIDKYGKKVSVVPDDVFNDRITMNITDKKSLFAFILESKSQAEILFPSSLVDEMRDYVKEHIKYLNEVVLPMYEKDGEM